MTKRSWIAVAVTTATLAAGATAARAEDVEKRWRVALSLGASDARDSIRSEAANVLFLTDENDIPQEFFVDPRADLAVKNDLRIETGYRASASVQYAISKILLLEFSGGYQKGDVGNIELQAQFAGDPIPTDESFNFHYFLIGAGEITQVPVRATAVVRFRPRASFNPYVGAGLGYRFVGFDSSGALNQLSANMDRSYGQFARLTTFPGGFNTEGDLYDVDGVTVKVPDSFEWHATGGVEYTFRRKWAAFFDLSYSAASRHMSIYFDPPTPSVGIGVPSEVVLLDDPLARERYGAVFVPLGGFLDAGRLVPDATHPGADCEADVLFCTFVFEPDGIPDRGYYYINGGTLRYDDITVLLGVRYTF